MVGDLLEAEVVAQDRDPQHDGGRQDRRERGENRPHRRRRDPAIVLGAGVPACPGREAGREECQDQRAAAEELHAATPTPRRGSRAVRSPSATPCTSTGSGC